MQELIEEIRELRREVQNLKKQPAILTRDRLLSSTQVLQFLGMKHNDKAWVKIRTILITEYGMTNIPGAGTRIPESNLRRFYKERYEWNEDFFCSINSLN